MLLETYIRQLYRTLEAVMWQQQQQHHLNVSSTLLPRRLFDGSYNCSLCNSAYQMHHTPHEFAFPATRSPGVPPSLTATMFDHKICIYVNKCDLQTDTMLRR